MVTQTAAAIPEKRDDDPLGADFQDFYREVAPGFHRRALARGLSEHDAHDVVQDVMLKILGRWRKVGALSPGERFGYADRALRHAITDVWRRQQRDAALGMRLRQESVDRGDPAERDSAGAEALRLVGTLTGCQYQVMVLAQEGLKPREIAAELGMRNSTVSSHLHEARRKLMTKLQAWKDSGREE
ncbi:putative RNA polymerase ECF-subfamily sigma factor [Actinoplanes missouriensis 431]|uniref:Putative RNA polymerase ECF-subfamily sigma factor n=1 Tax=Actinoplanes missouriensis (strain ATCC 14538 / DSM 43046 / CBS 188.64 / JCM 3121 / NBRC 102363 / NCIMB 12654 / NRRL B-3342 / UNCC 431) TaxID=512565 RepID=I0H3R3_ACTM4|nr:sigma-70 family RNA polymerase sigma factor [Actinoplanes missouriensis]BAL87650.1 putative RNA polymerase ECF-subfamily sigma factor [Actinoplanes missouriensis 431]